MNESIEISEIKNGIELSIQNSFELIEEAQILFKNERYSRAYTLTQLSLEEIGKSIMLYDFYNTLQIGKRNEIDFKLFRKNFRDHRIKTFESIVVDLLMNGERKSPKFKEVVLENFNDIQKNKKGFYDNLKNNSLYVSLDDGVFKKPSEIFEKKYVLKFIKSSKSKIEFSADRTLKWLRLDERLSNDKEGIITELQNDLNK